MPVTTRRQHRNMAANEEQQILPPPDNASDYGDDGEELSDPEGSEPGSPLPVPAPDPAEAPLAGADAPPPLPAQIDPELATWMQFFAQSLGNAFSTSLAKQSPASEPSK